VGRGDPLIEFGKLVTFMLGRPLDLPFLAGVLGEVAQKNEFVRRAPYSNGVAVSARPAGSIDKVNKRIGLGRGRVMGAGDALHFFTGKMCILPP